jgi:hypothetical protein
MGWSGDVHRTLTTMAFVARELLHIPFSANTNVMDRTKSSMGSARDVALYIKHWSFSRRGVYLGLAIAGPSLHHACCDGHEE